ncbi:MAG: zinc transporter, family [Rhodospirillaceae bacterium]|jgi:ZIP family zinc transporter|nr:zinc transporter, family [Rhodospirillaceae bacterium]
MWLYTLVPVAAAILGACYALWRPPGPKTAAAIQHFAAGVVFSAAAGEILPDVTHVHSALPVVIGGGLGILLMSAVRWVGEQSTTPVGLIATVAVDILVDGLVLGIAFAAGAKQGLILVIALTIEILFLGLSVATAFKKASRARVLATTAALSLLLPLGAVAAGPIGLLPPHVMAGFFAFGLIALLYLVTEELLVEAHKHPDSPLITAMFFVGFLLVTLLESVLA